MLPCFRRGCHLINFPQAAYSWVLGSRREGERKGKEREGGKREGRKGRRWGWKGEERRRKREGNWRKEAGMRLFYCLLVLLILSLETTVHSSCSYANEQWRIVSNKGRLLPTCWLLWIAATLLRTVIAQCCVSDARTWLSGGIGEITMLISCSPYAKIGSIPSSASAVVDL